MTRTFLATAFLLSTLIPATGYPASFDCKKAKSEVEKMICTDPEISKLDDQLTALYMSALASASNEDDRGGIKRKQRNWLRSRDTCRDRNCVQARYEQQIRSVTVKVGNAPTAREEDRRRDPYAEFYSLARRASYRLVYSAAHICEAIRHSLLDNVRGKIPDIYSQVPWTADPSGSRWNARIKLRYADDQIMSTSEGNRQISQEHEIVAAKRYFGGRLDDQAQTLSLRDDEEALTSSVVNEAFYSKSMNFNSASFAYRLRELKPFQFKNGDFGPMSVDRANVWDDGIEHIAANFFDLVMVNGEVLLSFRSHNINDMILDKSAREWVVFARLRKIDPKFVGSDEETQHMLNAVCYFVHIKTLKAAKP
jgi:uncharacterized protein YecT (DUF1311 family)